MMPTRPNADPVRALLDARSLALARRGQTGRRQSETTAWLVCRSADAHYGLPLAQVAGVLAATACTPIRNAPRSLLGITALSGTIVSVLDLILALGLDSTDEERRHYVRLRGRNASIAFAVERAVAIVGIDEQVARSTSHPSDAALDDADFGGDAVSGYAAPGAGTANGFESGFTLIDPGRLLKRFLS